MYVIREFSVPRAVCWKMAMGGVGMERGHIHFDYEMQIQQVQEVR
jgi:hypothetical protein